MYEVLIHQYQLYNHIIINIMAAMVDNRPAWQKQDMVDHALYMYKDLITNNNKEAYSASVDQIKNLADNKIAAILPAFDPKENGEKHIYIGDTYMFAKVIQEPTANNQNPAPVWKYAAKDSNGLQFETDLTAAQTADWSKALHNTVMQLWLDTKRGKYARAIIHNLGDDEPAAYQLFSDDNIYNNY